MYNSEKALFKMKMVFNASDYKVNHFYKITIYNSVFIFLLTKIENDNIYCSSWYIDYIDKTYTNTEINDYLINLNAVDKIEEIMIEDFIDILPNDNINKINYLRKERIKNLLNY